MGMTNYRGRCRRAVEWTRNRSLGTAKWIEAVFYALVSVNQGVASLLSGRELGTPLASSRSPVPGRRRSRFPLAHDWFVRRPVSVPSCCATLRAAVRRPSAFVLARLHSPRLLRLECPRRASRPATSGRWSTGVSRPPVCSRRHPRLRVSLPRLFSNLSFSSAIPVPVRSWPKWSRGIPTRIAHGIRHGLARVSTESNWKQGDLSEVGGFRTEPRAFCRTHL